MSKIQICGAFFRIWPPNQLFESRQQNPQLSIYIDINIDICPIYGPKSVIFIAFAQIWAYIFLLITQPILIKLYICAQETTVATSRAFWSSSDISLYSPNCLPIFE